MFDPKIMSEQRVKATLAKAEEYFDLAKAQHEAAETLHRNAARLEDIVKKQQQNAEAQTRIAIVQHQTADYLDAGAEKLDAVGREFTAEAIEIANVSDDFAAPTISSELLEKIQRVRH